MCRFAIQASYLPLYMRHLLLGSLLLLSIPLFGEDKKIDLHFKTDQWKDTLVLLSSYQGNSLKVIDTLRLSESGAGRLKGIFPVGQYALVLPDREQIELILNEKKVKVRQDKGQLEFPGSIENNLFVRFLKIERSLEKKRIQWQQHKADKNVLEQEIKTLETRRSVFISINRSTINKTFAGTLIKAISSPNDLVYYSQHIESAKWIKNKFLSKIDFTDERMFYTEVMHRRTQFFLDRVLENNADTLIDRVVALFEKSKAAEVNFRFLTDYYLHRYARSKNPQHEVVFSHLFETYCKGKQTPWIDTITQMRWNSDIQSYRNQLIGTSPVPIELYDLEGKRLAYDFTEHAYTLLIFWDPGCAHCRVEVPQYHKVYKQFKDLNFNAIAIYLESFEEPWRTFIEERNMDSWHNAADLQQKGNLKNDYILTETPTVLLVDANGIIVNKRFTARSLSIFLEEQL